MSQPTTFKDGHTQQDASQKQFVMQQQRDPQKTSNDTTFQEMGGQKWPVEGKKEEKDAQEPKMAVIRLPADPSKSPVPLVDAGEVDLQLNLLQKVKPHF